MPEKNMTAFRRVRNFILKYPEAYRQTTFCGSLDKKQAPCGTAACVAGRMVALEDGIERLKELDDIWLNSGSWAIENSPVYKRAMKIAGLSNKEARVLFSGAAERVWPEPFRTQYDEAHDADDAVGRSRAVANFLNSIIRTGKVK